MNWFKHNTPRERRTLILGATILGGIFGYFMFWEPFITARAQLENIVTAQQNTLAWMQTAAVEIQELRRLSHTSTLKTGKSSLLSLINNSLRQSILNKSRVRDTRKRIESKWKKEVQLQFEAVNFTVLMRWLEQLYNQHQIEVSAISIKRLQVPEIVTTQITFKKG